jgi:hypothetical protein
MGSTAVTPHFAEFVAETAEISLSAWPDFAQAALQPQHSNAVCRFHYPSTDAWRSQFIDRPHPVELLRVGDTSRAIIERVGDTDRLQWLDGNPDERGAAVAAIVARARRAERRFFMYSTAALEECVPREHCGLKARAGFIVAVATRPEHEARVRSWSALPWWVQSGDRL